MYSRRLTSIPERNETEEEQSVRKWVPKQKHEVLKAKYKCLKKLFQVYDASLINMLPDSHVKPEENRTKDTAKSSDDSHRDRKTKKKRKTRRRNSTNLKETPDVSLNETPNMSTDTVGSDKSCSCVATAVLKDLKMKQCTLGPTLVDAVGACESNKQFSNVKSIKTESESEMDDKNLLHANAQIAGSVTQNRLNEMEALGMQRCKWTRVQILKYRLFGQRPKARYSMQVTQQPMSLSDSLFGLEALRRRPRVFRYRTRQVRSCEGMLDYDPALQCRVQCVQQSCLLDTTPRVCPFPGCGITLNGIINYNDHLRLCHFPERKHVCNYCHDAFQTEQEKISHENGHIGIFKPCCSDQRSSKTALMDNVQQNPQRNQDVQCDVVSEEKLKRMVSYFDKIATGDGSFHRLGRRNDSCISAETQKCKLCTSSDFQRSRNADKCCGKSLSCMNRAHNKSEHIAMACKLCGDFFKLKNICSHMDKEHPKKTTHKSLCNIPGNDFEKDGELNVSVDSCKLRGSRSDWTVPKRDVSKSCVSLDYDPSTNIIFYNSSSMESICNKTSVFDRIVKKVKSSKSLQSPTWVPAPTVFRI